MRQRSSLDGVRFHACCTRFTASQKRRPPPLRGPSPRPSHAATLTFCSSATFATIPPLRLARSSLGVMISFPCRMGRTRVRTRLWGQFATEFWRPAWDCHAMPCFRHVANWQNVGTRKPIHGESSMDALKRCRAVFLLLGCAGLVFPTHVRAQLPRTAAPQRPLPPTLPPPR